MAYTVLITGGTGLIGTYLSRKLEESGNTVLHLSRSKTGKERYKTFLWNVNKKEIEEDAIEISDYIIHLAGANVSEKRWTEKRKSEILNSRVDSCKLIFDKLKIIPNKVKAVIGASGIGIYGVDTGEESINEDSPKGRDFIAKVTQEWENGHRNFEKLNKRVVILRIGLVLAPEGGALPKLAQPVKLGLAAALGSGKQYYSWIHIEDLAEIFKAAIENESLKGAYNATVPNPVSNKEFIKTLARVLNKPMILPNVPEIFLKVALGEMAGIVLGGSKVSPEKLQKEGIKFKHEHLKQALENLLKSN